MRPRIATAFSKIADTVERSTAGEILNNLPERLPAVAPLPFEAPRQSRKQPRHSPNLQSQEIDIWQPRQPVTSPDTRTLELREEKEEGIQKHDDARHGTTVVAPIASRVNGPEDSGRRIVEAKASPSKTQDLPVFNVARETGIFREDLPTGPIVPATPPQLPIFPARPPAARSAELPNEVSKTKIPSEPAIQVTIGKIEVRASLAPQKSTEKKTAKGVMSLEEYQRLRNRRSAG